ncbi:MAG: ketoacyl-ACP synthase III [Bacteroidales bacterium]|nr:ketoacyl-ACP synthase III [Bacteroidales bacterium]MCF8386932.1 ketoacyl-ACP synthase III [Bacteroidales bacterium]MCF8399359.1 ketoacyl-ACP synthase III [Bacteroidales bacterium]
MKSIIKAIEYYLPEKVLRNEDIAQKFPDLKIDDLTRLTGVYERHVADKDQTAGDLAIQAAEKLFTKNKLNRKKIDFLILCTSLGDYITPATSNILQDKLALPNHCGTFDFNQGCTGYTYGLSLAKGLIESGQAANVLLITSETISKKIHPKDKSNMAIFGDGAAATWITVSNKKEGIGQFVFGTDGSRYETIHIKDGGARFPYPGTISKDYQDDFGNVRNDGCFYMNGSEVFTFSLNTAPVMIGEILQKHSLTKDDIKLFVLHQANRIILESIFKKLKIRKDQEFYCLEKWGNTVQSTIPIALKEAQDQGLITSGDKVIAAGFGVGMSWSGTLLQF